MILQTGVAFLTIWILNWMWMFWEIIRHTPNWKEEDVTSDEIVQTFMTNTPLEKLEMIQKVAQVNPLLFLSGIALLLFGIAI